MSENGNPVPAIGGAPQFTERELQMLGWAMQSLKSGPPDVDFEKLAAYAGMTNPGSARNAWAKIRVKLTPATDGTAPATPKKTPRKKAAAKQDDGEEGSAATTPKKTTTPRKRAPKKQDVDGESSPKKKPARSKKVSDDEVRSEENNDVKMKTDPDEELEETFEEI